MIEEETKEIATMSKFISDPIKKKIKKEGALKKKSS
jgi:hypothetical protein